ncbi:MAG: hypothetical protein EU533_04005 [Promethearchaeota archaeon]|nr:MAG: hypothetical protein EU533_04005 [Candidatus Lokiarchaeota archaeon]
MHYNHHYTKEYHVNEFLKLRLEQGRTQIYVNNRPFIQCMYLLLNIPINRIRQYDEIDSIDEAAEMLDRSMEGGGRGIYEVTPEEEFRGHCSNIQAWYENDYDTRILHRNLAFPLLKRLTDAGDQLAKQRFKEEIALRYASGHNTVMMYLIHNGYLKYLTKDELECLLDDNQLPILNTLVTDFSNLLRDLNNEDLSRRLNGLFNTVKRYLGFQNIPYILSHVMKELSEGTKKEIVNYVYERYKNRKNFPIIEFLNNYIEYFDNREDYVNYNEKIISLFTREKLDLREKNIKNIFEVQIPEDNYSLTKELDLSGNLIKNVDGIENFTMLEKLNLSNNSINSLKGFNTLNNLKVLSLRNNEITDLEGLEDLKTLTKIDLSGNSQISHIPEFITTLPSLESIVLSNCNIMKFSEKAAHFFWKDQNYRYYADYNQDDVDYYEANHVSKAGSNGQLYKAFVKWLFKLRPIMIENNLKYKDLYQFEEETNKKSIWNLKPTSDFLNWLYEKPQTRLSQFW